MCGVACRSLLAGARLRALACSLLAGAFCLSVFAWWLLLGSVLLVGVYLFASSSWHFLIGVHLVAFAWWCVAYWRLLVCACPVAFDW